MTRRSWRPTLATPSSFAEKDNSQGEARGHGNVSRWGAGAHRGPPQRKKLAVGEGSFSGNALARRGGEERSREGRARRLCVGAAVHLLLFS